MHSNLTRLYWVNQNLVESCRLRIQPVFKHWIPLVTLWVVSSINCLAIARQSSPNSDDDFSANLKQKLDRLGVEPTKQGVKEFLAGYLPDERRRVKVKQLIAQLGDDRFQVRSRATAQLANLGLSELPLVKEAVNNSDLEVSLRAKQVLAMFNKGTHLVRLRQVLALIAKEKVIGLASDLSQVLDSVRPDDALLRAFESAIGASAIASDHAMFQNRLDNPDQWARKMFVRLLSRVPLPEGKTIKQLADEMSKLARSDDSPQVRLAACCELAFHLDRRCLPLLIDWLESDSVSDRIHAVRVLRNVTGLQHKFYAAAANESRSQAVKRWRDWYQANGDSAILFKDANPLRGIVLNRLVVSDYNKKTVVETDMNGKVIRRLAGVGVPMGVFGSRDGRILVCDYGGRTIRIFDGQGRQVFSKKLPDAPLAAEILENGNILTGTTNARKVMEFDPTGKVVWEATVTGRINVVHRTVDGTTLVSMLGEGKVVELDASGKVIFELKLVKPNGVRRLENGNTLVCLHDSGEVREYDSEKNLVWKTTGLTRPARAQRMPDGNTIIYCRGEISIVDPSGELVRKITVDGSKAPGMGSMHFF